MKITLYTKDGALTHDADIPPFNPAPDVVFWGTRIFQLKEMRANNHPIYFEAFSFALPDLNTYGDPLTNDPLTGMPPDGPRLALALDVPPDAITLVEATAPAAPGEIIDAEVPPDATDAYRDHELAADWKRDQELSARDTPAEALDDAAHIAPLVDDPQTAAEVNDRAGSLIIEPDPTEPPGDAR